MIVFWIPVIACLGGLAAWVLGGWSRRACRWAALAALALDMILTLILWARTEPQGAAAGTAPWAAVLKWNWIPQFQINVSLGVDGLTVLLLLLTAFLGMVAIAASWNEIQERVGFFHFNLMLVLTGVMGVFLALDLFLFYVFWELMLVPMYFLIRVWGHENRVPAAIKFFIFTQLGGLFMLLAVLGLYFVHGRSTGEYTFDYMRLLAAKPTGPAAFWLMMGFLAAFLVKLPAVPLHTWLPDAHSEAPTAGSIVLAGLLLKTGAYGLIRFVLPLFPTMSRAVAPVVMALGVTGILYGALLAFSQKDIKRLIAYTSVSHLGFVLLGVFVGSRTALQGSIIILLAHGLSTGGLFAVAGALQERLHTRRMNAFGGLWDAVPCLGGVALFFALASLGLPGLANFLGEFLVLAGSYPSHPVLTTIAAFGFAASTVYALWLIYRVFHGPQRDDLAIPDLDVRERVVFGAMIAALVAIGLRPQPVLDAAEPALTFLQQQEASRMDTDGSEAVGFASEVERERTALPVIPKAPDDIR